MAEKLHKKTLALTNIEVKQGSDRFPGGTVEGIASAFNNVDRQGEVVKPGAFAKFLKTFDPKKGLPLVDSHRLFDGVSAIIGRVFELKETSKGLRFKAFFSTVPEAQAIRTKIREGILTSLSIGFKIAKDKILPNGVRELLEINPLFEISLTEFPANPAAVISGVKSGGNGTHSEAKPVHEMHPADRDRLFKQRVKRLTAERKAARLAKQQRDRDLWIAQGCP